MGRSIELSSSWFAEVSAKKEQNRQNSVSSQEASLFCENPQHLSFNFLQGHNISEEQYLDEVMPLAKRLLVMQEPEAREAFPEVAKEIPQTSEERMQYAADLIQSLQHVLQQSEISSQN